MAAALLRGAGKLLETELVLCVLPLLHMTNLVILGCLLARQRLSKNFVARKPGFIHLCGLSIPDFVALFHEALDAKPFQSSLAS